MTINWQRFSEVVNNHQSFLLTSHIRPDCDALGSELGMAGILESLGKDVEIVNGQATPPNLAFIDPQKKISVLGEDRTVEDLADVDVLMVLDTSAWIQLGPMGDVVRTTRAKKFILDHHVGEDDLGAELFKDPVSEATGSLVLQAAQQLDVQLTPEIAMPLFAAVATDTGWYRFNSTTSQTYRTAAALVDGGAHPASIYKALYEQDSAGRVKLRGRILERFVVEQDGRLAHTFVRRADFEQCGALPSDTEDVINNGLAIKGVEVAVIFVELKTGEFKISFRSQTDVDCSELARRFDGGGHKAAAGATVPGPFEEAQTKVLDAVRVAMS